MRLKLRSIKEDSEESETLTGVKAFGTSFDEEGEIIVRKDKNWYKYSLSAVESFTSEGGETIETLLGAERDSQDEWSKTIMDVTDCDTENADVQTTVISGDTSTDTEARVIGGAIDGWGIPDKQYATNSN
jgi:hypothetical protein